MLSQRKGSYYTVNNTVNILSYCTHIFILHIWTQWHAYLYFIFSSQQSRWQRQSSYVSQLFYKWLQNVKEWLLHTLRGEPRASTKSSMSGSLLIPHTLLTHQYILLFNLTKFKNHNHRSKKKKNKEVQQVSLLTLHWGCWNESVSSSTIKPGDSATAHLLSTPVLPLRIPTQFSLLAGLCSIVTIQTELASIELLLLEEILT